MSRNISYLVEAFFNSKIGNNDGPCSRDMKVDKFLKLLDFSNYEEL